MRCLSILIVFLLFSYQVNAQSLEHELGLETTIDINQIAALYYEDCISTHASHDQGVADTLCSCTASGITQAFAPKDLLPYGELTEEGEQLNQTIMNEIYIPCTEYAIKDIKFASCMARTDLAKNSKRLKICTCMADSMGVIAASLAPSVIGERQSKYELRYIKDAPDPLAALMMSKRYGSNDEQINKICIEKHLLWLENQ